ncbi:hypothetical protein A1O7_05834 [Cladophialophora yegresii CBS 114405]|uniref:Uncharacterized protein n=1 Tax=Cladophialophora yegresii CBS 114405 TaxID=1182544 RepID=W9WIT8_9EURO|nr:uncharacterized protein A1O7_05834 [Cladophialophora yegresii CBS 114405]EXJ58409.1 hypothetical protein A1O7_05834 [Cladophialophora yegresii CBS 114405]
MSPKGANRRAPKRRKLRDSDSQNVEGCYYACEDQDYHVDPDVHVGHGAVLDGNKYWPLDTDVTDPTVNIAEPLPSDGFPEPLSSAYPDTKRNSVPGKRMQPHDSPRLDLLTGSVSLPGPSFPTTPDATPRVKLPYGNPPSSMNNSSSQCSSGYAASVEIPSPFLYHDAQYGYIPPSNTVDPAWAFPYFGYACGQVQPEPDFVSYRSMSTAPQARPPLFERKESLGLAFCAPTSSKHRLEPSCISDESHDTSTHGCPLPELLDCSDCEETHVTLHCGPSNTDSAADWQLGIFNGPEWPSAGDFVARRRFYHVINQPYEPLSTTDDPVGPKPSYYGDFVARRRFYHVVDPPLILPNTGNNLVAPEIPCTGDFVARRRFYHAEDRPCVYPSTGDNLIYPTLPTLGYAPHIMAAHRSINDAVQAWRNDPAACWEASAKTIRTLTGPDDHIMVAPPAMVQMFPSPNSYTTESLENVYDHEESDPVSSNVHIGAAVQASLPLYMDVVPARLYQHQYITWPAAMPAAVPDLGAAVATNIEDSSSDSENVQKLFDWLCQFKSLEVPAEDNQIVSDSLPEAPTEEAGYQCCGDVPTPEAEASARQCAPWPSTLHPDDEAMHCSRHDEGYVTASGHYSEVEVLSQCGSEDGWVYWDWESETENEDRPDCAAESAKQGAGSTEPREEAEQVEKRPATLWGFLV